MLELHYDAKRWPGYFQREGVGCSSFSRGGAAAFL